MGKMFRATLAALLAIVLTLGTASAVMVDEEGYLEEILLEDGDQIEFHDAEMSESWKRPSPRSTSFATYCCWALMPVRGRPQGVRIP